MKQRKVSEAGVTNPSKLSTKIADTQATGGTAPDRHVNYEESPAAGSSVRHTSEVTTPVNKIVGQVTTDIRTITNR